MSYNLNELKKQKRTESVCLEKLPLCAYEEKDINLLYELATSREFIENQVRYDDSYDLACQTIKYAILLHCEKNEYTKLIELLQIYQSVVEKDNQYEIAQWLSEEKLDKLLSKLYSYPDQKLFKAILYLILLEEDKERIKKILGVYRKRKKFNLQFVDFRIITWWLKHVCEKVTVDDLVYIMKTYDNKSSDHNCVVLAKILLEKQMPKPAHSIMKKIVNKSYNYSDVMLQIENALNKGIYVEAEPEDSISFYKPVAPDITCELENNNIDSILQRFTFEERSRILQRLVWDTTEESQYFLEKALENALKVPNAESKYGHLHSLVLSALYSDNFEFAQEVVNHFQKDYDRNEAMRIIAAKYFLQGKIEQGLALWRDPTHNYEYVMLYDDFSTYPNSKKILLAFLKKLLSKEKQQTNVHGSIVKILFNKGKPVKALEAVKYIKDEKLRCEMLLQIVKKISPCTAEFEMALDNIFTACKSLNRFDVLFVEADLCDFLVETDKNRAQELFISLCQKLPCTDIETFIKVKYSGEFFNIFVKIFAIAHQLSKLDFLEQTISNRKDILSMFKECKVIEILEQESMNGEEKTFLLAYAATKQWYNDRFKLLFAPILNALYGRKAFSLLIECVKSEIKFHSSDYQKHLDYPEKAVTRRARASNYNKYLDYATQCIYPKMDMKDIRAFVKLHWTGIHLKELAANLLSCGHSTYFVKSAFTITSPEITSRFNHSKIMQLLEHMQQIEFFFEVGASREKSTRNKSLKQSTSESTNHSIISIMLKKGNHRQAIRFAQHCSSEESLLYYIFSTILDTEEKYEYMPRLKNLKGNAKAIKLSTSEQIDLCKEFLDGCPCEPILLCLVRNENWTKVESFIDRNSHTKLTSKTFSKLAIIAAKQKRNLLAFKCLNNIKLQSVFEQTIENCISHFAKNNSCRTFTEFLQPHIPRLNNCEKILQKWLESIAL
ncbi:hypothetical protein [Candidatus Uabimicrobium sp. HlEnr_7]|uniref:hypothetical protein n=1 Tax=Candidatus Uabimicrobium helgolandensis TaxID=3095367 RepID=UPI003556FA7D